MSGGPYAVLSYYIAGPAAMDTDFPMSAGRSFYTLNNIQHLIDVSGQYRVSWVADSNASGAGSIGTAGSADDYMSSWFIPFSIPTEGTAINFDIRVAITATAGTSNVYAQLVPLTEAPMASSTFSSKALWTGSGSDTGSATSWAINTQKVFTADEPDNVLRFLFPFTGQDGTTSVPVLMPVMRFDVFGDSGECVGVQVREYV